MLPKCHIAERRYDLDLWLIDLKIDRSHFKLMMNVCIEFEKPTSNLCVVIIKKSKLDQLTDWATKQKSNIQAYPHFKKKGEE